MPLFPAGLLMLGRLDNTACLLILCIVLYLVHFVFKMLLSCTMSKMASMCIERNLQLCICYMFFMLTNLRSPVLWMMNSKLAI